ncbi:proteasome assembly chaperone 4 isoform X3 [Peromyscus californicus insignis]|uniref:proteasome assembly chaperone 4 isoform X3 n=1 Tax=Peromyscus californicus insignis TaxID=564181 RepID=UPI0022A7F5FE|nr:proteasome assembly chaperone 4 isoform X3 [Peromyscus californicus insignis]
MEEPQAAAGADVSLHNFSARLWEQLVHFHVMRLTDSLFLWVGATPQLRNLAVAMCSRYDPIPVCTSLFGDTSDTTSSGLAQRLEDDNLWIASRLICLTKEDPLRGLQMFQHPEQLQGN